MADGQLWFSELFGHAVMRHDPGGRTEVFAEFPDDRPSGLGWLPDGTLLVVGMENAVVYRDEEAGGWFSQRGV